MTQEEKSRQVGAERRSGSAAGKSGKSLAEITEADFHRIYRKLVAKVRHFGVTEEQVPDLVQETFLEAHRMLRGGRFKGHSSLDTWVISIGKHRCLKYHRARQTQKRKAVEVAVDTPVTEDWGGGLSLEATQARPDKELEGQQLLAKVVRAMRGLPSILRDPLLLRVRGHSYRQIGRLLGIKTGLVSSRIHQARTELHRELPDIRPPSNR